MRSMGDSVCRRWVCITRSWVSWWGHTKMQEVCATFLEMIIIPSTTVRKKKPKLLMVLHGTSGIGSSVICQTFPSGFPQPEQKLQMSEQFRFLFFLTSLLQLEDFLAILRHFTENKRIKDGHTGYQKLLFSTKFQKFPKRKPKRSIF